MKAFSMIFLAGTAIAASTATADELGLGNHDGTDSTPPETTTESCTSTLECAWQELLDIFEMDTE